MAEEKRIPELRFPEFGGEWFEEKLGNLMSFKNGINATKDQYGSGYKFINVLDIIQNNFITHENIIGRVNVSEEEFKKNIVEFGDILFQRSSETREEVGQANVYLDKDNPATFGGFVIRGKRVRDYDPLFMNYLLKTVNARSEITNKSGGSTRYNVGQNTLSQVNIVTTNPEEQQKIASFLAAVDERIRLLQNQKEKLERYKKGVMQQIFRQEIRFKQDDGSDYPDWEERKLGEVYEFKSTNSYSRNQLTYNDGEVKNIHYGDIHTRFSSSFKIGKEKVPYLSQELNVSGISEESYLTEGDLVIADASEDYADIGKAIEIIELNGEKVVAGLHTLHARRLGSFTAVGFGGHLMKSYRMRRAIMKIAQGTKVLGISAGRMAEITIPLPSIEEQQKIAAFLSVLDEEINGTAKAVEATQKFKKGLLQKMFV